MTVVPTGSSKPYVDFDGCIDTPTGPELREAKADHSTRSGGSLFVEPWSRAPKSVLDQGGRQFEALTQLRLSHPGKNISLNWYAQMADDQAYIRNIFDGAGPPIDSIRVIHLPWPR